MEFHAIFALVLATVILALVPGPIVAALVGRALFGGFKKTYGFLSGVFVGDLIWLIAAVSGLGYLAHTYSMVFLWIKYAGALYLIYLGGQALRAALVASETHYVDQDEKKFRGNGFISGLLVTLGNPKLVAFYVGFLPTFIDMETLSFGGILTAAILVPSTFALINAGWAFSAAKARNLFKSNLALKLLNGLSGGLLVGAGGVMLKNSQ